MKFISLKVLLTGSLVITILVPAYFAIQHFLSEDQMSEGPLAYAFLFTFTVSVLIFLANGLSIMFIQRRFAWKNRAWQRFSVELIWTSINAIVLMTIVFTLANVLLEMPGHGDTFLKSLFDHVVIALIFNTIAVTMLEANDIYNQWKKSLVEAEHLKRQNVENQFAALKNQVNPHFLFNNFNTLSSLISDNPEKAQDYLSKLAGIYRYILEVRDEFAVEVQKEMEFLDDFIYLHQIRYGENLKIEKHLEAHMLHRMVPVLSMQILAENAIKHNEISDKKPLQISLVIENGWLVMTNNLQRKKQTWKSTGVGLSNLKERYRLLSDQQPLFYIKGNQYIAKIPLLNDE